MIDRNYRDLECYKKLAVKNTEDWESMLQRLSLERLCDDLLEINGGKIFSEKGYSAGKTFAKVAEKKFVEKIKLDPEYFEYAIPYLYCLAHLYQEIRRSQPAQKSYTATIFSSLPVLSCTVSTKEEKIEGCQTIKSFIARGDNGSLTGDLKAFIQQTRPKQLGVIYESGSTLCAFAQFVEAMCKKYQAHLTVESEYVSVAPAPTRSF